MADDDIFNEEFSQHRRADFPRVGAGFLEVEILRAEADLLRAAQEFRQLGKSGEGRGDDDLDGADFFDFQDGSSRGNSAVSVTVMFIFQFAAMIFFRMFS